MPDSKETVTMSSSYPLEQTRNVPMALGMWLWTGLLILTLSLLPVYWFSSGKPQLVDLPLAALLAAHFLRRTHAPPFMRQNIALLLPFLVWAGLVNLFYFLVQPSDLSPLWNTAYLLYAFLILLAFSHLFWDLGKTGRLGLLYPGIFLSIILIFTVTGYREDGAVRSVLSFNNPNQLGYYGLILACLAALLLYFKDKRAGGGKVIYFWCDLLILVVAHFLVLLSLSRGAIMGVLLLDLWILPRLTKKVVICFLPLLILTFIGLAWQPAIIQERLGGRPGKPLDAEETTKEVGSRILHQLSIMEGMHYLVGRGGRSIPPQDRARGIGEVHNIFGEIFRCFGLVGLFLFSLWLGRFIWRSRLLPGGLWIWAALLLYNMSHYGLRFRSFWVVLALLNVMLLLESRRREEQATEAEPREQAPASSLP